MPYCNHLASLRPYKSARRSSNAAMLAVLAIPVLCLACGGCRRETAKPLGEPPQELGPVLQELRYLAIAESEEEQARFRQKLQWIAARLPEVVVTAGTDTVRWTKVTCNQGRERFAAVRFVSPLDTPADMRWGFVVRKTDTPTWYILPADGTMPKGFDRYEYETEIAIPDLDAPADNMVFLQPLDGGLIAPRRAYLLWFAFGGDKPITMQIAIRLKEQGQFPPSSTSEALARDLGIPTPFRRVNSKAFDGLLRSVEMCYIHRDLVGALQAVEQARLLDADHRSVLKYSASLNLSRGLQLLERGEATEAGPHLFRAAQDMRRLQEKYSQLDSGELRYLAETTYYAGLVHARQGDADQAVLCLEQSLAEGTFPISAEEVARDYALLHGNPTLQAVLDKLKEATTAKKGQKGRSSFRESTP